MANPAMTIDVWVQNLGFEAALWRKNWEVLRNLRNTIVHLTRSLHRGKAITADYWTKRKNSYVNNPFGELS